MPKKRVSSLGVAFLLSALLILAGQNPARADSTRTNYPQVQQAIFCTGFVSAPYRSWFGVTVDGHGWCFNQRSRGSISPGRMAVRVTLYPLGPSNFAGGWVYPGSSLSLAAATTGRCSSSVFFYRGEIWVYVDGILKAHSVGPAQSFYCRHY